MAQNLKEKYQSYIGKMVKYKSTYNPTEKYYIVAGLARRGSGVYRFILKVFGPDKDRYETRENAATIVKGKGRYATWEVL
jgi:hypothetical protein